MKISNTYMVLAQLTSKAGVNWDMPTHGSLSKAGKIRSLNGPRKDKSTPNPNPRINNKRKYNNRIILQRGIGQYYPNRRRYRRRRRR